MLILDHELEQFSRRHDRRVSFNREGRSAFLRFALGPEARWSGNFRDLAAAGTRMATLAPGGRIGPREVGDEIGRLRGAWRVPPVAGERVSQALGGRAAELDRFERVQLEDVLSVCASSRSLSEAGRVLFAACPTSVYSYLGATVIFEGPAAHLRVDAQGGQVYVPTDAFLPSVQCKGVAAVVERADYSGNLCP